MCRAKFEDIGESVIAFRNLLIRYSKCDLLPLTLNPFARIIVSISEHV